MSQDQVECIIFDYRQEHSHAAPSGSEVGRVTVSRYKWAPGNAIEKFVKESRPPAGRYLVQGVSYGHKGLYAVFNVYDVSYPEYTISGTRSGSVQIYGAREPEPVDAT